MKKHILIIAIFSSIYSLSHAQFHVNTKFGLNIAKIKQIYEYGNYTAQTKNILRPMGGIEASYYLKNTYGIKLGLIYSGKGSVVKTIENEDDKWVLNYLELPLNFSLQLKRIEFEIGGYFAYGLSGRYTFNDDQFFKIKFVQPYAIKGDMSEIHINNIDYGITGSISIKVYNKLSIRSGISQGFEDISPIENWKAHDDIKRLSINKSFFIALEYELF